MKKILAGSVAVMLLLSGCGKVVTYVDRGANVVSEAGDTYVIKNKAADIAVTDAAQWNKMLAALETVDNEQGVEYWRCDAAHSSESYVAQYGVELMDGSVALSNIDADTNGEINKLIKENCGEDLTDFIDQGKQLKEGNAIEKIQNGFGFVMMNKYGNYSMIIMKSSLGLKDSIQNEWLQQVCGNELLVSTISKGEEKQIYELSSPGFIADCDHGLDCTMPLSQYQIFTDGTGNITKVRAVFKQEQIDNGNGKSQNEPMELTEEMLQPLMRIMASKGTETDGNQLVSDVLEVNKEGKTKLSGTVSNSSYKITGTRIIGDAKLLEAVIQFQ